MSALTSAHQLGAALTAASTLSHAAMPRDLLERDLGRLRVGGTYSVAELTRGLDLLILLGFAVQDTSGVRATRSVSAAALLMRSWEQAPPSWLPDAVVDGVVDWAAVPEDAELLTQMTGTGDGFLRALHGKVDTSRRHELGLLGELEVVNACRRLWVDAGQPKVAAQVEHVAALADGYGFDVTSPTGPVGQRSVAHLEVKACARRPHARGWRVYLSRNEVAVARTDPSWRLVVCEVGAGDTAAVVGWAGVATLVDHLPLDAEGWGRWESARLDIPLDLLVPGLPVTTSHA